jgi:preprotein translocase subunit YajC
MGAIIVINLAVITGFMAAVVYFLYSRPEAGEQEAGEAKTGQEAKTGEKVAE